MKFIFILLNGDCKNILEDVKIENDEQIAIINSTCNLSGTILTDDYNELKFDLMDYSITERSLNKKLNINVKNKGILSIEYAINPQVSIECVSKYEYYEFTESQNICEKCKH